MGELETFAASFRDDVGFDTLRRSTLFAAVGACVVGAVVFMLVYSRPSDTGWWVGAGVLGLYLVATLAALATRRSVTVAGLVLIGGLLLLSTVALWIPPMTWLAQLMPALVLLAFAFAGAFGGLATAVGISLALLIVHQVGGPIESEAVAITVGLTWANCLLAWVGAQPTKLALDWSWSHYLRAEWEADRARRQQAEFAEAVRSLNVAQDRLEQTNRELERARRAAEDAQRLKAEFAAMISHELRTPLNLIIGFSELMAAGTESYGLEPLPATYQRDVDTIYRNARHLSSLIDDILDLARIDALRMGLLRERVALADLTSEAAASIEPLFRRKGLSIEVDVSEELPLLLIDRTRVRQILVNLLSNAGRFTDVGGVRIEARVDDHEVVVAVSDTGIGIAPDDLPRVFEEFRQVESSMGRRIGGSGLGLAISKRFVELHGGAMWVESSPGRGSTFYFTLPLTQNVVSTTFRREWETWAPSSGDGARRVVVIHDNEPDAVLLVQRHLDAYQVTVARDVGQLGRIKKEGPISAVALMGSNLPSTWSLAQQIQAVVGDLPVMICSIPGRRDLSRELGVFDYLVKPILREHLARILRLNGRLVRDLLVIDDDPDLVDLLARMTRSIAKRVRIRSAYGGIDGLAAMRERRPDLVLLDLQMPGVDGYAVLQAMRSEERLRDVPVVVVTAGNGRDDAIATGMLGITRGGGLGIAELMRVMKASLDVLNELPTSSDPVLPGGRPGSSV